MLEKYNAEIQQIGFNPNNGIGDLYTRLEKLGDDAKKAEIEEALKAVYTVNPPLAMVNSAKGGFYYIWL